MPSPKSLTEPNATVDCNGQRALVSGGTQGIGAGVALRYALAGASVYIVGRSEDKGNQVLETLRKASTEYARRAEQNKTAPPAETDHSFFKADLTDVTQLKDVVQHVKDKTRGAGVDHVVMTQGGPPIGYMEALPGSGIEKHFAVQCLSRFGLAYLMTKEGLVKRSITVVAVPGQGGKKPLDVDDLDLLKAKASGKMWDGMFMGAPRKGARDSSVIDAFMQKVAEDQPALSVLHLFPGIVQTQAAANKGAPGVITWLFDLVAPIIANQPGPGGYAEVPFYLANNPEGQKLVRKGVLNCFNEKLRPSSISANVEDKGVRDQIWNKLASHFA